MRLPRTIILSALLGGGLGGTGHFLLQLRREAWLPGPGEILNARPDEAIYGAVWLLAVAVTAWVALTAVLSVFAYTSRLPATIRAVEWMTLPPIRRLARRFAALLLAVGNLSIAPAVVGATAPPPVPVVVTNEQSVGSTAQPPGGAHHDPSTGFAVPIPLRSDTDVTDGPAALDHHGAPTSVLIPVPLRAGDDAVHLTIAPARHRPPVAVGIPVPLVAGENNTDDSSGTVSYTVQPGDSMWSVTVAYLSHLHGEQPAAAGITRVWREVIDLNRDRIRSGNPDVIFPGEELLLPRYP